MQGDTCENCGQPIGKLETPMLWGEHIVCGACHQKLGPAQADIQYRTIVRAEPVQSDDPLEAIAQANTRRGSHVNYYAPTFVNPPQRVQLTERTGKGWKAAIALGVFIIAFGLLLLFNSTNPRSTGIATFILVLGLTTWIFAKVGAWWNHG